MYNKQLNDSYIARANKSLHGKSVAVVGNGSSLFMDVKGVEIDSHDVVIRFGKGVPDDFNAPHVGRRTDMWCFTSFRADPRAFRKMNPKFAFYSLAQIGLYKPNTNLAIPDAFVDGSLQIYEDFGLLGTKEDHLAWAKVIYKNNFKEVRPSQGMIFLQFMRRKLSSFGRVTLYGFDFFESQFDMKGKPTASWHCPILRDGVKEVPHDVEAEKTFVNNLLKKDPRFTLSRSPNITQEVADRMTEHYRGIKK